MDGLLGSIATFRNHDHAQVHFGLPGVTVTVLIVVLPDGQGRNVDLAVNPQVAHGGHNHLLPKLVPPGVFAHSITRQGRQQVRPVPVEHVTDDPLDTLFDDTVRNLDLLLLPVIIHNELAGHDVVQGLEIAFVECSIVCAPLAQLCLQGSGRFEDVAYGNDMGIDIRSHTINPRG